MNETSGRGIAVRDVGKEGRPGFVTRHTNPGNARSQDSSTGVSLPVNYLQKEED